MSTRLHLIRPHYMDALPVLWAFLRAPKGVHNLLFVDGWENLSGPERGRLNHNIGIYSRRMDLPYRLRNHGWIWSWEPIKGMESARKWFDQNEAEGRYPEMVYYHPERSE